MEFSEKLKVKILQVLISQDISYKANVGEVITMDLLSYLDRLEYTLQELVDIQNELDYKLSDNQLLFVFIALENNLELSYDYSGRGMYGEQCPSVVGNDTDTKYFSGVSIRTDSAGKYDTVIYAQN
jgi:hypothetical protein